MKKAIHTKTQEQFNRVLEIFESKGWIWITGSKPTKLKDNWEAYKKETCLKYDDRFSCGSLGYYKKDGYEIVSFEEFLKEEGLEPQPHYVYVSDKSVEDALKQKEKRILVADLGEQFRNRYITVLKQNTETYLKGENNIGANEWKYIAEIPKEEEKIEMSIGEIADRLGIDKSRLLIKE